jgi:hypothetical protein
MDKKTQEATNEFFHRKLTVKDLEQVSYYLLLITKMHDFSERSRYVLDIRVYFFSLGNIIL